MNSLTFTYYAVINRYGHMIDMGASGKPFLFKNKSKAMRRAGPNGHVVTLTCTATDVEQGSDMPTTHSEIKNQLMKLFPSAFTKSGQ